MNPAMKSLHLFCLSVFCLLSSACTSIPPEILGGQTGGYPLVQFGGKLELIAPNGVQISIDNQKSFEDANRTLNSLGTGYILASAQKAIEAGKRAVESDSIKAATSQARIDSDTTLGLAKEETARMMIEAEAAPAAVIPPAP